MYAFQIRDGIFLKNYQTQYGWRLAFEMASLMQIWFPEIDTLAENQFELFGINSSDRVIAKIIAFLWCIAV